MTNTPTKEQLDEAVEWLENHRCPFDTSKVAAWLRTAPELKAQCETLGRSLREAQESNDVLRGRLKDAGAERDRLREQRDRLALELSYHVFGCCDGESCPNKSVRALLAEIEGGK